MEQIAPAIQASSASRRRIRRLTNLCFAMLALLVVATIGVNLAPGFDDSKQYRQAARNIVESGDPYATTRLRDAHYLPYPNPPLLAYLLVPTLPLGEVGGRLAWFALNLAAAIGFFWVTLRIAGPPWAINFWGLLVFALAFSPPTYLCLLYGQLGIMLALLLVASFALAQRRSAFAGATIALAAVIKLYPGLPTLYYLLRGPRRVILWATAAGVILLLIPVFFHGLQPYQSYYETVLRGNFYPYAAEFNVSLMGLWQRLLTETGRFTALANAPTLALALTALTSLATLALCVRFTDTPGDLGALLSFSMWICATMLLSPINGYYNLTVLLLPLLVIARGLTRYPSVALSVGALVSTGLICLPPGWYDRWVGLGAILMQGWGLIALVPAIFGIYGYLAILIVIARRHRRAVREG
jgi:hypothetical protein